MMEFYLISSVFIFLTTLYIKHNTWMRYEVHDDWERLKVPRWVILCILLVSFIPVINVFLYSAFIISYIITIALESGEYDESIRWRNKQYHLILMWLKNYFNKKV